MSIRQLSTYMLYVYSTVLLMGRVEMWWGGTRRYLRPHISTPCSHVHTPAIHLYAVRVQYCIKLMGRVEMWWGGTSVLIYQPHVPMSIRQLSTYMLYMYNTALLMGRVEMWWGGTSVLIYQPHVPMSIRQLFTYCICCTCTVGCSDFDFFSHFEV